MLRRFPFSLTRKLSLSATSQKLRLATSRRLCLNKSNPSETNLGGIEGNSIVMDTTKTSTSYSTETETTEGNEGETSPVYQVNRKCVYMRYVPRSYDVLQVADLVKEYGPVLNVQIYYFKNSRESKGTCKVEFCDEDAAAKALKGLHERTVEGGKEPLQVDLCKTAIKRESATNKS